MPVIGYQKTGINKDAPWDAGANVKNLKEDESQSYYDKEFAWRTDDADGNKSKYKFPHHLVSASGEIGEAAFKALAAVIAALNGGRNTPKIPSGDFAGVYAHIKKHYKDAGVKDEDIPELKSKDPDDLEGEEPEEEKNRYKKHDVEYRTTEVRAMMEEQGQMEDGTTCQMKTLEGRAIVFDSLTELFVDPDGVKYFETIDKTSLDGVDLSNVVLKYNHSDHVPPLASTKAGSMDLTVDEKGLNVKARVANTTQARDIYELVKSGELDKMSFKFNVIDDSYNSNTKTRTIHKFGDIYDVSIVDFPAYEQTCISARSYFSIQKEEIRKQEDADKEIREKELRAKEAKEKEIKKLILKTY